MAGTIAFVLSLCGVLPHAEEVQASNPPAYKVHWRIHDPDTGEFLQRVNQLPPYLSVPIPPVGTYYRTYDQITFENTGERIYERWFKVVFVEVSTGETIGRDGQVYWQYNEAYVARIDVVETNRPLVDMPPPLYR
ncbi:MAG: hypothetical protein COU08_03005 [Candidatus Harrisonbacteria bacterium CG10_big_fil_rev_8_21_14_0_10_42_17]|uniref:Uncharacterized protein n=1 Tax=Candidatus Harrisonbacteria bacterium CG10_big_fil_rev_8_21_14_0_10_42_17 TaxID=1974584 RepID=A0A2M6WHP7_9BACT|nr:MAG: hypothetical protein COU08_03005 [Candidatus Harrisonbacteria bacterium CG10_big_fil_rev_8_21_14_0_10_42_17]